MQQTPSFLPIPTATGHGPKPGLNRQGSFGGGSLDAGPSRWGEGSGGSVSGMTMMPMGTPPNASPSSNPHSGFHPGSYGAPLSFSALALGATQPGSSPYSSSMAMSISPPRWGGPGSLGGFGGSGSFVGSVGALGTSFGRHTESRERELEAKYVKDFTCCGRRLSGLHELLEHYEEEHANLAPDVRMAAINAVQSNPGAKRGFTPNVASTSMGHSDVPVTPGMMDMDMDEPAPVAPQGLFQQGSGITGISINVNPTTTTSPWSAAFRPTNLQPPACVPPSVLSYAPPAPSTPTAQQQTAAPQRLQTPTTPTGQQSQSQSQPQSQSQQQPQQQQQANLSQAEIEARLFKKAAKKAEQRAAKESGDDDHEAPSEKRFRCPIEGCGKVYKQANGLKYHLTRSINSGHGNVAAMGGLLSLLGEDKV